MISRLGSEGGQVYLTLRGRGIGAGAALQQFHAKSGFLACWSAICSSSPPLWVFWHVGDHMTISCLPGLTCCNKTIITTLFYSCSNLSLEGFFSTCVKGVGVGAHKSDSFSCTMAHVIYSLVLGVRFSFHSTFTLEMLLHTGSNKGTRPTGGLWEKDHKKIQDCPLSSH